MQMDISLPGLQLLLSAKAGVKGPEVYRADMTLCSSASVSVLKYWCSIMYVKYLVNGFLTDALAVCCVDCEAAR